VATETASSPNLFLDVLATLERIGAPYMVVGALAAIIYGVQRNTHDIDLVVDLNEQQVQALAGAYPSPRYDADPEQMRDSLRYGTLFKIIDTSLGDKADFVSLRDEPQQRSAFRRRVRQPLELPGGELVAIWCARREDVIIGKLAAWSEGRSRKHESDILQMLIYAALEAPDQLLAVQEIAAQAARLGEDTLHLWTLLERKAAAEVAGRRNFTS
jgi:hypothetical protein